MSKRRSVNPDSDEEVEEKAETPLERRARRERERRAKEKGSTKRPSYLLGWPLWKKLAVFGGVAIAVVAALAVVLLYVITPPCLVIGPPPASSGVPDESAPSWCVNSSVALEQRLSVTLVINIAGTSVSIPGGIGEIPQSKWGWTCTMPVFTDNSTGTTAGSSGGIVEIASPWNFTYTISDFFNMWKESFSTTTVSGTSEPVSYTGTQIFNYTSNAHQVVRLWVNGALSNAGVNLVLNTLPDNALGSSAEPTCFLNKYGSNNVIEITWGWVGAGLYTAEPVLHEMPGTTGADEPCPACDPALAPLTSQSVLPPTVSPWALVLNPCGTRPFGPS